MAIALIVFKKLGSGTKVVTRLRGLSIRTKIRGLFKTGTPGLLFVSTSAALDPPNRESEELDIFRNFVYTVQGYDRKDKQIKVAHYGVADYMKVAFEKEKIRRVQTIPAIVEVAEKLGSGGDIVGWLNKTLNYAAGKDGMTWSEVWGDGAPLTKKKGWKTDPVYLRELQMRRQRATRQPGDPLIRRYYAQ